jgi:flagellar hook-length control protein FliK
MPSTATTNVTINTILDLIGPTPSSIGSDDDGQSAFDSVLNRSTPTVSSCQPTPSSKRSDEQRPAATDSRRDDSRPTQSATSDTSDDSSSEASQSKRPDKTTQADSPVTRDDQDDLEHPEEDSADVQQLIAQSLAAIPAAAPISALPAATEEATTPTEEIPAAQAKSKAAQAISRAAQKTGPQTQADDPQTVSPVTEIAAATTEEQPSQPASPTRSAAKQPATDESAKPATTEKTEVTAESDQSPEVTFESTLDNDKSSQSPRQESSAEKQSQRDNLDPTAVAPTTPDATTTTNPTDTPIVAPVATALTDSNQTAPAKTADQNQASAVGAPGPRSRLPAQALAPANASNNRRPAVEVDSARLLTRVVRAFSAAQDRDGEVHLRLSPPELGSLRLDIRVDNGALTARMQTETDAARTAIIDNLPALRERLAQQGVRIERFDVDLMQRQPGGMPDQQGGRQPETTETTPRFVQPARASSSSASQPSLVSPATSASGGLNVIV